MVSLGIGSPAASRSKSSAISLQSLRHQSVSSALPSSHSSDPSRTPSPQTPPPSLPPDEPLPSESAPVLASSELPEPAVLEPSEPSVPAPVLSALAPEVLAVVPAVALDVPALALVSGLVEEPSSAPLLSPLPSSPPHAVAKSVKP